MQKPVIIASILISVIVIVILVMVLYKDKKEGFKKCICSSEQGGREENCQDTDLVQKLYETNQLTESSNLPSKGWSTVSPGDVKWPDCEGCPDTGNNAKEKQWFAWDYTDFGSV